jgi:hypothetical protein
MSIGWLADVADADSYFDTERLETDAWDDLVEDSAVHQKSKAILMAYNRLYNDPKWKSLPTYPNATAAQKIKLRKANCEMAYYLAQHLDAEDHRKAIQAQGVVEAGIVKEKYSETALGDLPVPPFVAALLDDWLYVGGTIGFANIGRNDEESVRTKVHDF